jgi:hypothetical protein
MAPAIGLLSLKRDVDVSRLFVRGVAVEEGRALVILLLIDDLGPRRGAAGVRWVLRPSACG